MIEQSKEFQTSKSTTDEQSQLLNTLGYFGTNRYAIALLCQEINHLHRCIEQLEDRISDLGRRLDQ